MPSALVRRPKQRTSNRGIYEINVYGRSHCYGQSTSSSGRAGNRENSGWREGKCVSGSTPGKVLLMKHVFTTQSIVRSH